MKFLPLVLLTAVLSPALALAQDRVRGEIFAGYSLEHISPCGSQGSSPCGLELGVLPPTMSFNGWNASITGYLYPFLGLTADVSGHYGSSVPNSFSRYSYLFGPTVALRVRKFKPFAHALFGAASESATVNSGLSYEKYARAVGGGLDIAVSRHFAVRVAQFDYEWVNVPAYGAPSVNGLRYSGGVVFKF